MNVIQAAKHRQESWKIRELTVYKLSARRPSQNCCCLFEQICISSGCATSDFGHRPVTDAELFRTVQITNASFEIGPA